MCMKLRQTVSRNVWWWQSNRGLCSTMWSGCWGKLTGNSIIGRLPPLNGNGDDDGYTPPHHNNGFTPPLRLGNWAAPSTLDHFLYSSVISRGIKLLKLYNWILSFYCGDSEGSNLNGENSHEESVVPMMTTALLSCDSKLNYWRGLLNRHVQSTRHYRYIRRYKLYSRGVQQPPLSACCLLSFEIKPTEKRIFEDLLRLIGVAPRKAQTQTLPKNIRRIISLRKQFICRVNCSKLCIIWLSWFNKNYMRTCIELGRRVNEKCFHKEERQDRGVGRDRREIRGNSTGQEWSYYRSKSNRYSWRKDCCFDESGWNLFESESVNSSFSGNVVVRTKFM